MAYSRAFVVYSNEINYTKYTEYIYYSKKIMESSRASSIASALNQVMHLDEGDQASLLEVIADYFTMPSSSDTNSLAGETDSEEELEAGEQEMSSVPDVTSMELCELGRTLVIVQIHM